jgi:prepilin-type N-terminal cleavage/methylation domain-containing protein
MSRRAFTLVELLVVVSIIGLMSTIAVVSLSSAKIKTRNTQRKADLVQLSKALDLYYADYGSYPATGGWWSEVSAGGNFTVKENSGANGWIPNIAPTYIAILPRDPNTNIVNPSNMRGECRMIASWNGYAYNSNGVDYKILAHCTPEGALSVSDQFADPPPWNGTIRGAYRWGVWTPGAALW